MTANVLSFPDRFKKAPQTAESGAPTQPAPLPPSRGEQIILKKQPIIRDPRARVEMPLSVLEEMTDALIFYSRSGFDHGVIAARALTPFTNQPGDVA